MARYSMTQVTQLSANEQAAINNINKNFEDLESAIQDTVSRSGNTPTHMTHDLDMNGKRIINVPAPTVDTDLVRRKDVVEDVNAVKTLVNTATNASAQALAAAQAVQEIMEDEHLGIVADDLALGDDSKIKKTADNIDDISNVADNISAINTANNNIENIDKVADDISNVNNVSSNMLDVNTCADNISAIQDAPNQASAAAGSASDASGYATNASGYADAAAASAQEAAEAAAGIRLPLLWSAWFDHVLNDISWLRADTFSWQSGAVYKAVYDHLVDDVSNGSSQTETIAGVTIGYYLSPDGHKIVDGRYAQGIADVEAIYNATGVAWYYILDTTNQRFKLPRTKFGFTGLRDAVGKYVSAGLPNITGRYAPNENVTAFRESGVASGAFKKSSETYSGDYGAGYSSVGTCSRYLDFDASSSNSIYGNSTTVQPQATQMYLYFYVGNYNQSATEQTAGLNAELFNGKADVDLSNAASNASATAKQTIVGWGMPDYSAGVTVSTTPFIAPYDGVIGFYQTSEVNDELSINVNGTTIVKKINSGYSGLGFSGTILVSKNDTISVDSLARISTTFYPLKGV